MKNNILIDTDMGYDDIMAILMLCLCPTVKIKGITTVNGVSGVPAGTMNLRSIFNFLKIRIPVVPGRNNALVEKTNRFPAIDILRAENLKLLPNICIPKFKRQPCQNLKAEDYIYKETIRGNISIIALGPLTNIAMTILKYKDEFCKNIREIIVMGGGINKGNVPSQFPIEYNIFLDPEAANIVFKSKIKIRMVGIDAISNAPAFSSFIKSVKRIKTSNLKARIIKDILINNQSDFDYFYDPLTAYVFLNPSIITNRLNSSIRIILSGQKRGQTMIRNNLNKNVEIVMNVDERKFYRYILKLLKNKC